MWQVTGIQCSYQKWLKISMRGTLINLFKIQTQNNFVFFSSREKCNICKNKHKSLRGSFQNPVSSQVLLVSKFKWYSSSINSVHKSHCDIFLSWGKAGVLIFRKAQTWYFKSQGVIIWRRVLTSRRVVIQSFTVCSFSHPSILKHILEVNF